MIIDAHTHGMHGKYLDQLADPGGDWAKRAIVSLQERAKERPQWIDVDLRVQLLDKYGIDLQVVTSVPVMDSNILPGDAPAQLAYARALNDNMARMMEDSKGRLLTIGTIPLSSFEQGGRQEMERAIKSLGLKGVNLPSNINGKALALPEFEPFWAHVAEMDIPVYIHPLNTAQNRTSERDYVIFHSLGHPFETALTLCRLVFSGVIDRYPTLKIVNHHGGGMIPFFLGRINETYLDRIDDTYATENKKRRTDLVMPKPLFDYFSRFYVDTAIGGSVPAIRCTYEAFGADRLLFATDAPNGPDKGEQRLADYPNILRSVGLSKAENEKIFASNARKLLKLD
jgi:predicted TIM-barrel fold metal-dependent hydrolase